MALLPLLLQRTTRTAIMSSSPRLLSRAHHCASTPPPTSPRHFLSIADLTSTELSTLVQRAADAKHALKTHKRLPLPLRRALAHQTVAITFSKRSTRTRVSTEGAVVALSGHPMFLGKDDIQLGVNESVRDTATVLSSMSCALVARVGKHAEVEELAKWSSVPVINALSDAFHPLQAVCDILTIKEAFPAFFPEFVPSGGGGAAHKTAGGEGKPERPLKVAWVGDANNVLYDLMLAAAKSGVEVAVATPAAYPVPPEMLELARACADETGVRIATTTEPREAVRGADVLVTDTWISMGQESEKAQKLREFAGYQISHALARDAGAAPGWKFMHCLPRHPEEVTDEVFYDAERSLVFPEAENRLYAAIAAFEAFVVNKGKVCPGKRREAPVDAKESDSEDA